MRVCVHGRHVLELKTAKAHDPFCTHKFIQPFSQIILLNTTKQNKLVGLVL